MRWAPIKNGTHGQMTPLNKKMYENLEALKTALFLRATGVPILK